VCCDYTVVNRRPCVVRDVFVAQPAVSKADSLHHTTRGGPPARLSTDEESGIGLNLWCHLAHLRQDYGAAI